MLKVFNFTFVQQLKSRTFSIVSIVMATLLIILSSLVMILIEVLDKDDVKSKVDYIYVCDSSVLSGLDYNVISESGNKLFADITFINYSGTFEEAAETAAEKSENALAMEVKNNDEGGFDINILKSEKYEDDDSLDEYIKNNLRYVVYEKAGLTDEQKTELSRKTVAVSYVIGKENSTGAIEFVRMFAPLFFGIALYMMVCIYGQNIARCVVVEKDSKIIENMLTLAKPYDIIFGKIFGQWLLAIVQFSFWILSLVSGLGIGVTISDMISKDGESSGEKLIEVLGNISSAGAFSLPMILISLLSFASGFLLFCSLSALFGSFATKTEEVNNYYGIYTLLVVACWMAPYMIGLEGNESAMSIIRMIPLTAPFTVPADALLGNMTMASALLSTLGTFICAALFVFLAAKIYKAFVLYKGNSLKPKDIIRILKKDKSKNET